MRLDHVPVDLVGAGAHGATHSHGSSSGTSYTRGIGSRTTTTSASTSSVVMPPSTILTSVGPSPTLSLQRTSRRAATAQNPSYSPETLGTASTGFVPKSDPAPKLGGLHQN